MRNNAIWFWVLAGTLITAAAAQPVSAERNRRHGGKGGITSVCKTELKGLCKDVKPGKGRLRKCLKEHEPELSADCRGAMMKKRKPHKKHPCAGDREKFCKDLKGKNRATCMREHKEDLSKACRAKRAERKEKNKGKRRGGRGRDGKAADNP